MKRIIGGVAYNTETSAHVGTLRRKGAGEGPARGSEFYLTRSGRLFAVHWTSGADSEYVFEPLNALRFRALVESPDVDGVVHRGAALLEFLSGEVSEEPEATVFVRLPASLKRRLDHAAQARNMSVNALALRWFEQCLAEGGK